MRGFVPTPSATVALMVEKLFAGRPPRAGNTLLDPGCGPGAFIEGVQRWCAARGHELPAIVGVELSPERAAAAATRFAGDREVRIRQGDFLRPSAEPYDYIIGNPPYVPITAVDGSERDQFRQEYETARGRFDLYLLFFEQALRLLAPGGRLVFITPEKYLYTETARPLRRLLGRVRIEQLHFLDEATFGGLVTYPLVTTIAGEPPGASTEVVHRDGSRRDVILNHGDDSWLPVIRGARRGRPALTLSDLCLRISCGVATGADGVFVAPADRLNPALTRFSHPTVSGRQLGRAAPPRSGDRLLSPYRPDGTLLSERELGALGIYLSSPTRKACLIARTCVARKPWYAWHENPPLRQLLRPKLLCKDIGAAPYFALDREGLIVPRHSVYYVVPGDPACLDELAEYLNSAPARRWMMDHCQRAANGFVRLQSHVLKQIPLPPRFGAWRRPRPRARRDVLIESA